MVTNLTSVTPTTPAPPAQLHHATSFDGQRSEPHRSSVQLNAEAVNVARSKLVHSTWYHSPFAINLRTFIRGKFFSAVMMGALVLALFMPDLWVLIQEPKNIGLDITLLLVMGLFAFEFVGLSLTDASYIFSFFFYMDFVGTVSMIADISFIFGVDSTKPVYSDTANRANLIVLRAARAAKLGARAGRLSRILKILRYIPFLQVTDVSSSGQMARIIFNKLTSALATRVACLTIVLVVVLPIFGLVSFPDNDYSMDSWVERLSRIQMDKADAELKDFAEIQWAEELPEFAEFFISHAYGPYKICLGQQMGSNDFRCNAEVPSSDWSPSFKEPERKASILILTSKNLATYYNFESSRQSEAAMSIALIICLVVVMIGFSMLLSNSVSALALVPFERMLSNVKQIAQQIFKYTTALSSEQQEDEADDDELDDIAESSELNMLEKVVTKLAYMAELSSQKQVSVEGKDLQNEDLGILNMIGGNHEAKNNKANDDDLPQFAEVVKEGGGSQRLIKRSLTQNMKVDELGVSIEVYNSWHFDSLAISRDQRSALSVWALINHPGSMNFVRESVPTAKIQKFISLAEQNYLPNPYHNFSHTLDVLHTCLREMKKMHAELIFTELDQFALSISAVAHDVGHPGVNNPFLIESSHDLALRYNDKSPLENMHCAKLFEMVTVQDANIFEQLPKDAYKDVRKIAIEAILHTDMVQHFAMVKDLTMLYQMNSDVFDAPDIVDGPPDASECELMKSAENKKLAMNLVLHSADVSNPCKVWDICHKWAQLVLDEFFAQGDQEKSLGIPVQMLNDRDKVNKPSSQIGFIEFVVAPLCVAQIKLFPSLYELGDNLVDNMEMWEQAVIAENKPSDEEKTKTHARIMKVATNVEEAKNRGDKQPKKQKKVDNLMKEK